MTLLLLVLFAALVFEYINGFHDTANSIATVVSTKVLTPRQAILLATVSNMIGALGGAILAKFFLSFGATWIAEWVAKLGGTAEPEAGAGPYPFAEPEAVAEPEAGAGPDPFAEAEPMADPPPPPAGAEPRPFPGASVPEPGDPSGWSDEARSSLDNRPGFPGPGSEGVTSSGHLAEEEAPGGSTP